MFLIIYVIIVFFVFFFFNCCQFQKHLRSISQKISLIFPLNLAGCVNFNPFSQFFPSTITAKTKKQTWKPISAPLKLTAAKKSRSPNWLISSLHRNFVSRQFTLLRGWVGDQELFRDRPHAYNGGRAETTKQQGPTQHMCGMEWRRTKTLCGARNAHFPFPQSRGRGRHLATRASQEEDGRGGGYKSFEPGGGEGTGLSLPQRRENQQTLAK